MELERFLSRMDSRLPVAPKPMRAAAVREALVPRTLVRALDRLATLVEFDASLLPFVTSQLELFERSRAKPLAAGAKSIRRRLFARGFV
jgi:hypothetical protein